MGKAQLPSLCKGLRATQVRNFSLLCWAIFRKRTTVLSELARCLKTPRRHIHRLKRLWRFVSNTRFKAQAVMDAICLYNLAAALRAGARKIILLDITYLDGDLALLCAAIACRGRAIPICIWVFERSRLQRSENTLTHQMLAHLKGLIGNFVLVADRGFGHAWTIRCCRELGIDFVLRIKEDVRIYAAGESVLAGDLLPPSNGRRFHPNARYHGEKKLKVNIVAIRKGEAKWLLVTSLKDLPRAAKLYEQRMQIEETFRDLKSGLAGSREFRGARH